MRGVWRHRQGAARPSDQVKIFPLQDDHWQPPRTDVFLRMNLSILHPKPRLLKDFSLCYWLRVSQLSGIAVHASYAVSDANQNALSLFQAGKYHVYNYNSIGNQQYWMMPAIEMYSWIHYCHSFTQGQGYEVHVDGLLRYVDDRLKSNFTGLHLNGTLILGQEQDALSSLFNKNEIFRGRIAQINIWNKRLTDEEIQSLSNCRNYVKGDIFSSDVHELERFNVDHELVSVDYFCQSEFFVTFIGNTNSRSESVGVCSQFACDLFAPDSDVTNDEMIDVFKEHYVSCRATSTVWLGLNDSNEEGVWVRDLDGSVSTYHNFVAPEPDGGTTENCAAVFAISPNWHDLACDDQRLSCAACERNPQKFMHFRGLCFDSPEGTFMDVMDYVNTSPTFVSYYGLIIHKTDADGEWLLYDAVNEENVAIVHMAPDEVYPIGRKLWILLRNQCRFLKGSRVQLTLSPCSDMEFTCDTGECLPIGLTCNGISDCADGSDEEPCHLINYPEDFISRTPPTPSRAHPMPIDLQSSVKILRFISVNTFDNYLELEMEILISWTDDWLEFRVLQDEVELNRLSAEEEQKTWTPNLIFDYAYIGQAKAYASEVQVQKLGYGSSPHYNEADRATLYRHGAGLLTNTLHISGKFDCDFDVFRYPFDEHECSVLMRLASARNRRVTFENSSLALTYDGPRQLVEFYVENVTARAASLPMHNVSYSILQVTVALARIPSMAMLNILLPSFMLSVIAYSTLFIRLQLLQVRLPVSLTTMLVLYTLSSQATNTLPTTSYVKMIDVWFLSIIVLIFVMTLTHVVIEWIQIRDCLKREREMAALKKTYLRPESNAEKSLRIARVFILPLLLVTLSIISWSYYLK